MGKKKKRKKDKWQYPFHKVFRRVIHQNELGDMKGIKQGGGSTDWGGANAFLSYINKPELKSPHTGIREKGTWGQSITDNQLVFPRQPRQLWPIKHFPGFVSATSPWKPRSLVPPEYQLGTPCPGILAAPPAPSLPPPWVRALSLEYFRVSMRQNLSILSGPWWRSLPSTVQSHPLPLLNSMNNHAGVRYPAGCWGHKNQQTAALLPPPGAIGNEG